MKTYTFKDEVELIQHFLTEIQSIRDMVQRFGTEISGKDKPISIADFALLYPYYIVILTEIPKKTQGNDTEQLERQHIQVVKFLQNKYHNNNILLSDEVQSKINTHVQEVVQKIQEKRLFSMLKSGVSTVQFLKQLESVESDVKHLGEKKRFMGNLKNRVMGTPRDNIQKKFKKHIEPLLDSQKYTLTGQQISGGSFKLSSPMSVSNSVSNLSNLSKSVSNTLKNLSESVPEISESNGSISLRYKGRSCSCSCSK